MAKHQQWKTTPLTDAEIDSVLSKGPGIWAGSGPSVMVWQAALLVRDYRRELAAADTLFDLARHGALPSHMDEWREQFEESWNRVENDRLASLVRNQEMEALRLEAESLRAKADQIEGKINELSEL